MSSTSRKVSKSFQGRKEEKGLPIEGKYIQRPRSLSKLERFGAWEVVPHASGVWYMLTVVGI